MRAKPILVLGGACLVALAAAHLMAESSAPRTASANEVAPAVHPAFDPELNVEVGRPGAEVRALPGAAAPPVSTSTSTPEPGSELTPQERAARAQEQVARVEQDLGDRLRAERVDRSWAHDTERTIAGTLAGPPFSGLQLEDVTCGATLCRLSLTANDQVADVEALVGELTSTQPFRHGGFLRFTSARALTMFVARKGHPLPPPPRT